MIDLARHYIHQYFQFFLEKGAWYMFTHLAHSTLHIPDDVERFGAGAGSFSAYPFESQLAVFPKVKLGETRCLLVNTINLLVTMLMTYISPIQLMQGSRRPVVQMARRLAAYTAHCDPTLTEFDFETEAEASFDDDLFKLELELMRDRGEIDLPPNIPLARVEKPTSVLLSCTSGGSLSTL